MFVTNVPSILTQVYGQLLWQNTGNVLQQTPACDVGVGLHRSAAQDRQQQAAVDLGGRQQHLACR